MTITALLSFLASLLFFIRTLLELAPKLAREFRARKRMAKMQRERDQTGTTDGQ